MDKVLKQKNRDTSVYFRFFIFFNSDQMISFLSTENLMLAYQNACKSRKNKKEVYIFNQDLEKNLNDILKNLIDKTYIHG